MDPKAEQPVQTPGVVPEPTASPLVDPAMSLTPAARTEPVSPGEIVVDEQSAADEAPSQLPSYQWEAIEFVHHDKSSMWYMGLFAAVVVSGAALAWFKQYTVVALVIAMAVAVAVISRKPPHSLEYELDEEGITVDGKKTYYEQFRSYSVLEGVVPTTIDLESSKRLVPPLSIICEGETFDSIEAILADYLPRHDRKPDWVDRATQYLHF